MQHTHSLILNLKIYNKIDFIFEARCRRYQPGITWKYHVIFNSSGFGLFTEYKHHNTVLSRIGRFFPENRFKWLRRLWFYQFVWFKLIRRNLLDRLNQLLLVNVCLKGSCWWCTSSCERTKLRKVVSTLLKLITK